MKALLLKVIFNALEVKAIKAVCDIKIKGGFIQDLKHRSVAVEHKEATVDKIRRPACTRPLNDRMVPAAAAIDNVGAVVGIERVVEDGRGGLWRWVRQSTDLI